MSRPTDQTRPDLYTRVTNAIVTDLERGVSPWTRPWSAEHLAGRITRPLRYNGQPYSGINVILLWSEAVTRGFGAPIWMTFRQALELGGHVRKGEHGATVVYAKPHHPHRVPVTMARMSSGRFLSSRPIRSSTSIRWEGLPSDFYVAPEPPLIASQRIEHADRFFSNTGAELRHGGDRAYYALTQDYVQMPPFECFSDRRATTPRSRTRRPIGLGIRLGWIVTLAGPAGR